MAPERSWPAFFSYLFHPLFVPLYAVASFFAFGVDFFTLGQKYLIMLQVFILTVVLPILFFLLLRSLGQIKSVMIPDASQRRWPLVFQIVLLLLLIRHSLTVDFSSILYHFFLGALISTASALIFVFGKIKISLHALSMAAWLSFSVCVVWQFGLSAILWLSALTLLTGLVLTARLVLKAHSMTEIVLGFVAGALPQMLLWPYWL